ncbi:MAG: hypothetical protein LBQ12_05915 [Deltaproteobacteria bacterium]|jgi:hypothetical protein|nr:hypothetical protein [Deltaproteobacteria bacterium]
MPLARKPFPRLFIPLAAALAAFAAFAADVSQAQGTAPNSGFTIESQPGDTPPTLKYKAALRLFASVQAVHKFCSDCGDLDAWQHYERRNGTTIGLVARQFGLGGGVGEAQKQEVDRYSAKVREDAGMEYACPALMEQVRSQKWDIYKAERFDADYQTVKAK